MGLILIINNEKKAIRYALDRKQQKERLGKIYLKAVIEEQENKLLSCLEQVKVRLYSKQFSVIL